MSDVIHLLPDSVANQIAAGEVIQRPASAVKELIENAVDAGATLIKLIIKDAGKQLIQVVDNGSGMSNTDARMSFERHATSKLSNADDLFNITTKGFRGEALASIAAIAHVEMKTRMLANEVGTEIHVHGSSVVSQEACSCAVGTSIAIKNLFYNTPARRNFLKSNPVETSHIVEELQRVAFAHPEVAFIFHNNDEEIFNLETGNLRRRIVALLGNQYNEKLVPVEQTSSIVNINGYVVKPEFSRKTRGEQYFFLNHRFIKNSYLHHAVLGAFADLLPSGSHPSYFLNLQVNPAAIDVNIHPTKTEVKFEDEKSIYAIIRSVVKQSLGKYNIAPSLSFETESSIDFNMKPKDGFIQAPTVKIDTSYNPFKSNQDVPNFSKYSKFEAEVGQRQQNNIEHAHTNYDGLNKGFAISNDNKQVDNESEAKDVETRQNAFQIGTQFIITKIKSGLVIIDQQAAAERILYEKNIKAIATQKNISQQLLFPQTLELSNSESSLLKELLPDLNLVGFEMEEFGQNTFIVRGIPSNLQESEIQQTIQYLIENVKQGDSEISLKKNDKMARLVAQNLSLKSKRALAQVEINALIEDLFACENPFYTANGKSVIVNISIDELMLKFK